MSSVTGDVQCAAIPIFGDDIIENDETLFVRFEANHYRDQVVNGSSTVLNIKDDDGMAS